MRILCVGISVRHMVESAVKAGYDVLALDYFGDMDTNAACRGVWLQEKGCSFPPNPDDYWRAARDLHFDAFAYTSPLENSPLIIKRFMQKARLYGCPPHALMGVRNLATLQEFCKKETIAFPHTYFLPPSSWKKKDLLLKPKKGGGGKNVMPYRGTLIEDFIAQEYVPGVPCSVTFLTDGKNARIVSTTKQLIGEKWLGAEGFSWCGNIVPQPMKKGLEERLEKVCARLTERFGLAGCVGMDFILADDVYVLEVNPRICGSMDAVEESLGINLFDLHMRACEGEIEGDFFPKCHSAKAIVYANRDLTAHNTGLLLTTRIRDIPNEGARVGKGEPLCSVLAKGETRRECMSNLKEEVEKAKRFFYGVP